MKSWVFYHSIINVNISLILSWWDSLLLVSSLCYYLKFVVGVCGELIFLSLYFIPRAFMSVICLLKSVFHTYQKYTSSERLLNHLTTTLFTDHYTKAGHEQYRGNFRGSRASCKGQDSVAVNLIYSSWEILNSISTQQLTSLSCAWKCTKEVLTYGMRMTSINQTRAEI